MRCRGHTTYTLVLEQDRSGRPRAAAIFSGQDREVLQNWKALQGKTERTLAECTPLRRTESLRTLTIIPCQITSVRKRIYSLHSGSAMLLALSNITASASSKRYLHCRRTTCSSFSQCPSFPSLKGSECGLWNPILLLPTHFDIWFGMKAYSAPCPFA